MVHKKLKEIYNVDTLSQDKGWKIVLESIANIDDDVEIDFTDIHITYPWDCPTFIELLKNKRVHMKFTNKADLVKDIQMTAVMAGGDKNNITNVVIEQPKKKTAEELKVERLGMDIVNLFEVREIGGKQYNYVEMRKFCGQINNYATVSFITFAIDYLGKNSEILDYIIDLKDMSISENVLEDFARLMIQSQKKGLTVNLDLSKDEYVKKLGLFYYKATNKEYTPSDRYRALLRNIKPGTPGLLIKYKKSRAVDEFGRHGKGVPVSSRIAIFRALKADDNGGSPKFLVDVFNNDYFYTKQHWMSENDNEELTDLHMTTERISMESLGFHDMFLGMDWHFMQPIQRLENENERVVVGVNENGGLITKVCTIPERMKIVFDDWGISYNEEVLNEYIEIQKRTTLKK